MEFEKNTDIENELGGYFSPYEFVKSMKKINEIDKISSNYSENVYDLCRNAVAWMIKRLEGTYYLFEIKIVEGTFNGKDHAWLIIGNYYVDLTLAQFIECPKLAICKIEKGKKMGYNEYKILEVNEWIMGGYAN